MIYDKQFLMDAFLWRYTDYLLTKTKNDLDNYVEMIYNYYSSVDKDTFRKYACLSAEEIQKI